MKFCSINKNNGYGNRKGTGDAIINAPLFQHNIVTITNTPHIVTAIKL